VEEATVGGGRCQIEIEIEARVSPSGTLLQSIARVVCVRMIIVGNLEQRKQGRVTKIRKRGGIQAEETGGRERTGKSQKRMSDCDRVEYSSVSVLCKTPHGSTVVYLLSIAHQQMVVLMGITRASSLSLMVFGFRRSWREIQV
jgi:hypothetical protein